MAARPQHDAPITWSHAVLLRACSVCRCAGDRGRIRHRLERAWGRDAGADERRSSIMSGTARFSRAGVQRANPNNVPVTNMYKLLRMTGNAERLKVYRQSLALVRLKLPSRTLADHLAAQGRLSPFLPRPLHLRRCRRAPSCTITLPYLCATPATPTRLRCTASLLSSSPPLFAL